MANTIQFSGDKYASTDTAENYEVLEEAILDIHGYSGAKVLNLFSNVYGLQLFNQENTKYLLEELGYVELDEPTDNKRRKK